MDRINTFDFDIQKRRVIPQKTFRIDILQTIVIIMILLFVIGIFVYFVFAHQKIKDFLKENNNIDAYLNQDDLNN